MARRIVEALPENSWADQGRPALGIDDWLEVHWRNELDINDENVAFKPSEFHLTRFGDEPDGVRTYASIANPDDRNWIRYAAKTGKMTRVGEKADPGHLARLHSIQNKGGIKSYEVELITGDDYKETLHQAKMQRLFNTARKHWMLITVGAVSVWWWFG